MPPILRVWQLAWLLAIAGASVTHTACAAPPPALDFDRQILPILSDNCFKCHGPDTQHREADLRLDERDGLFAVREGKSIVAPGAPHKSTLLARITSTDPDQRMPPAETGVTVSPAQIELLRRWIEQGAPWRRHWSFVAPQRPAIPNVRDTNWCRTPLDRFVLARLEREGLPPAPEADPETLVRRLTLDLTGLPPAPEEVDAYVADRSPAAYERLVDRLLASPRFGERFALSWLDLARYADTSGYQNDGPRSMWRWRDWVIAAFNADMPFDEFTIDQIAGGLLLGPLPRALYGEELLEDAGRLRQLIATGFHRNHRGNAEGGIIPEEFQVEYVVDRVETTATAWLGLTLGCTRCHDHKYDPFSQREFYQLFAFFNNVPEYGRAIKEGNSPPFVKAPTDLQLAAMRRSDRQLAAAARHWDRLRGRAEQEQAAWEASFASPASVDWAPTAGLVSHFSLDSGTLDSPPAEQPAQAGAGSQSPPAVTPDFRAGIVGSAVRCDGIQQLALGDVARFGYFDKFSFSFWFSAESDGTLLSRMTPVEEGDGYALNLHEGHIQVNLVKRWLDDSMRVETQETVAPGGWHHLAVTYDGSRRASGLAVYIDGQAAQLRVHHDFLNQTMANDQPLRIGAGHAPFRGLVDELRIYDRDLQREEIAILATADSINAIVAEPAAGRTPGQAAKIREYYLAHQAEEELRTAYQTLRDARSHRSRLLESMPTVMIMREREAVRSTHLLRRGQYDQPGDEVTANVPAALPPLDETAPRNRLGLAQWLVDPGHPLTARVAVNRYWQNFFGLGIVATPEDFGLQGARPTHPELLDWLATEFVGSGWDLKAVCRMIVLSATYRQSSAAGAALLQRDPGNLLLARGPRFRLPAEMIRDQALAASGLLVEQLGGPSVKIYQPEGLWLEIASDTQYDLAQGQDLYRRSLYSYWKRTVSPPSMATFDAPSRETCIAQRPLTNTPLQALAVMNDVTYVEAARGLAERVLREVPGAPAERIERAFRLVASRRPTAAEQGTLERGLQSYLLHYRQHPEAAEELTHAGQSAGGAEFDRPELAAYTIVASLILNLDESLSKE